MRFFLREVSFYDASLPSLSTGVALCLIRSSSRNNPEDSVVMGKVAHDEGNCANFGG
jgi:hypothetical protein